MEARRSDKYEPHLVLQGIVRHGSGRIPCGKLHGQNAFETILQQRFRRYRGRCCTVPAAPAVNLRLKHAPWCEPTRW